ncbi:hypothetical protein BRYFOR_09535 [Marvinbryantia formatexigens DSM 14469]|uniref:Uncharacterized protein n=1 Tax=Marvinbryantia formatexigens DSM 14469 TaxID=478749 RepID=C6LLI6_9FIRM|nr:hypothetical protein BRYFOR_09535 [Marvinbryantia formatexigens DSM 14469]
MVIFRQKTAQPFSGCAVFISVYTIYLSVCAIFIFRDFLM